LYYVVLGQANIPRLTSSVMLSVLLQLQGAKKSRAYFLPHCVDYWMYIDTM